MNMPAHAESEAKCEHCSSFSILDIWRAEVLRSADSLGHFSLGNTEVAIG